MIRKTLLLNDTYEVLCFISERRALKLLFKEDKVEVISNWMDYDIVWDKGNVKYPSILRLKKHVKINYSVGQFSRKLLVKRDKSTCQYCGFKLCASQVTVDHVIPRAQGGITSYTNCVISCQSCNFAKADRTPEQANMVLKQKPMHPSFTLTYSVNENEDWHQDWSTFLIKC